MNKKTINKDLKVFLVRGYKEQLNKIYKKFPETTCAGCGVCCTDSPVTTYPELLYIMDYLRNENIDEEKKQRITKNALLEFFYGLIDPTVGCPFLDGKTRCVIHKVAPIACKRWGLQSKEENDQDWEIDYSVNQEVKEYYLKLGIELSDNVINRRIPYCDRVKVINNPHSFVSTDFDEEASQIEPMIYYFGDKTIENFTLCTYISYITLGEMIFNKRIQLMRKYNSGDKEAINTFVKNVKFKSVF